MKCFILSYFFQQENGLIRLTYLDDRYGCSTKSGLEGRLDEVQNNLLKGSRRPDLEKWQWKGGNGEMALRWVCG